jgi:aryl-alcohol dehydrogenase-like predicted oxidoreductase
MYPVPPARETQGLTDKYISTWLKDQKREGIVLATKVGSGTAAVVWTFFSGRQQVG